MGSKQFTRSNCVTSQAKRSIEGHSFFKNTVAGEMEKAKLPPVFGTNTQLFRRSFLWQNAMLYFARTLGLPDACKTCNLSFDFSQWRITESICRASQQQDPVRRNNFRLQGQESERGDELHWHFLDQELIV